VLPDAALAETIDSLISTVVDNENSPSLETKYTRTFVSEETITESPVDARMRTFDSNVTIAGKY
jgi:hypothetical protein